MRASQRTLDILEQLRRVQHVRITSDRMAAYESGKLQTPLSKPARHIAQLVGLAATLVASLGWLLYTVTAALQGLEPLPMARPLLLVALAALVAVCAYGVVLTLRATPTTAEVDRLFREIIDRNAGEFSTTINLALRQQAAHVNETLGYVRAQTSELRHDHVTVIRRLEALEAHAAEIAEVLPELRKIARQAYTNGFVEGVMRRTPDHPGGLSDDDSPTTPL